MARFTAFICANKSLLTSFSRYAKANHNEQDLVKSQIFQHRCRRSVSSENRVKMKKVIGKMLGVFNVTAKKKPTASPSPSRCKCQSSYDIEFLKKLPPKLRNDFIENLELSKSQLRQDLFVLSEVDFKKKGYFVEFGATNGLDLSNTYLLEKQFEWNGILAEPAKRWHSDLKKNRTARIDTRCVWSKTAETLVFNETDIGELSTIDSFSAKDKHAKKRKTGNRYEVQTITLTKLLDENDAPAEIDYLSIDTEGSELAILENFDFHRYKIKVITCEHNYTSDREKIYQLLTSKGYLRKFEFASQFDDWYVMQ